MDFSESYPDSSSSVALAARAGDLEILKRLVGQGKTIESQDNRGWRPIHEAACHAECLKFLVTHSNTVLGINVIKL
jgi:ankyrin repeat/SOCS box protein 3